MKNFSEGFDDRSEIFSGNPMLEDETDSNDFLAEDSYAPRGYGSEYATDRSSMILDLPDLPSGENLSVSSEDRRGIGSDQTTDPEQPSGRPSEQKPVKLEQDLDLDLGLGDDVFLPSGNDVQWDLVGNVYASDRDFLDPSYQNIPVKAYGGDSSLEQEERYRSRFQQGSSRMSDSYQDAAKEASEGINLFEEDFSEGRTSGANDDTRAYDDNTQAGRNRSFGQDNPRERDLETDLFSKQHEGHASSIGREDTGYDDTYPYTDGAEADSGGIEVDDRDDDYSADDFQSLISNAVDAIDDFSDDGHSDEDSSTEGVNDVTEDSHDDNDPLGAILSGGSGSFFSDDMDDFDEDEDLLQGFDIDEIISKAIDMGASDIHIDSNKRIGYRVNGDIIRDETMGEVNPNVLNRVYALITSHQSQADFAENLELDTAYKVEKGRYAGRRLRLSVLRSFGHIGMVFRIISDNIPSPESLGIDREMLEWTKLPSGLILVGGPTGSGKDLHKDTLIPTVTGFKKLDEIVVGDQVFDENGKKCIVLRKHPGGSERFFKIVFKNGQVVHAGGNHLWNIIPVASSNARASLTDSFGKVFSRLTPDDRRRLFMKAIKAGEHDYEDVDTVFSLVADDETRRIVSEKIFSSIKTVSDKNGTRKAPVRKSCMLLLECSLDEKDNLSQILKRSDNNEARTAKKSFRTEPSGVVFTLTTQQIYDLLEDKTSQLKLGVPSLKSFAETMWSSQIGKYDEKNFGSHVKACAIESLSSHGRKKAGAESREKTMQEAEFYGLHNIPFMLPEDKHILLWIIAQEQNKTITYEKEMSLSFTKTEYAETVKTIVNSLAGDTKPVEESNGLYKISYTLFDVPLISTRKNYLDMIDSIVEEDGEQGDYYCLEVSSESHLFLCTESFIVTHNTTTFASMLRKVQLERPQKIITIEKPIEFVYPDDGKAFITQREIGSDSRSFSASLTSAMRQDPDILMVQEVRDRTEVDSILRAAETGHLSFSTIHTNTCAATIDRIKSLYEGDEQIRVMSSLQNNLRGLANQTLLKTADGKSRFALQSVLSIDNDVKDLIGKGDTRKIEEYMRETGKSMEYKLVEAVKQGRCSFEEARSHAPDPLFFDHLLPDSAQYESLTL